ncbi:hypothetical protein [Parasedimentitalea psychrophila]|uniref:Uncharacterized protein n=1 Tax=Parasedimentitalea psychrophila TaxID=2997337 RepID=A0A9Y2P2W7_9RHOB|nr:hypothetical protein [Parasedimentitalea psychrophila]WIY27076.1 hypothetical protein QPJ95_09270 [Parasedimentitalea psychrophila]
MSKKLRNEVWQRLMVSNDLFSDLSDVYTPDFFINFTRLFDKSPQPVELVLGVHNTARAYLSGKQAKTIEKSGFLKHTGKHLFSAGLAAQQLAYALRQVSKSDIAASMIQEGVSKYLTSSQVRGTQAHRSAEARNGPEKPLNYLQDISEALTQSIGEIIPLPGEDDDEREFRHEAKFHAMALNKELSERREPLPKFHALETAASAFRPIWETYSKQKYIRGRYHHDRGGYVSEPGYTLYQIISKMDSQVAESLAGTAIENIRSQLKDETRSV